MPRSPRFTDWTGPSASAVPASAQARIRAGTCIRAGAGCSRICARLLSPLPTSLKVEISIFQDMALSICSDVHKQNQFTAITTSLAFRLSRIMFLHGGRPYPLRDSEALLRLLHRLAEFQQICGRHAYLAALGIVAQRKPPGPV